jgi:hypothetical protein
MTSVFFAEYERKPLHRQVAVLSTLPARVRLLYIDRPAQERYSTIFGTDKCVELSRDKIETTWSQVFFRTSLEHALL